MHYNALAIRFGYALKLTMLCAAFAAHSAIHAMVYDNRQLPLLAYPQSLFPMGYSFIVAEALVSTADDSVDDNQKKIGLPEIWGPFDQARLAEAFVCAGCSNPLRPDWQGVNEILWKLNGKRQMQGAAFMWYQQLSEHFSMGTSWLFMRVNSSQNFKLAQTNLVLGPNEFAVLDQNRREMFCLLGLDDGITHQSGFGDIDWFLRYGRCWEYELKMRSIRAGARAGLLIPTGVLREQSRPSSVPFGGNGHWGIYGAVDALFEVKDQMYAGVYLRLNKRFSRNFCARMPRAKEPQIFGVLVADADVDPGVTAVFVPCILLEGLRPGLGIGLYYSVIAHREDDWQPSLPQANRKQLEERSEWASEYATINIYYDLFAHDPQATLCPRIQFRWNIPADMLVAHWSNRIQNVALGMQLSW